MKNLRIIVLLLLGVIPVINCKKNYPPSPAPPAAPEFTFSGTIGANTENIQAGVSNYYMFTSYDLDANSVYEYSGEFRDKDCSSNCVNSLKITFKDYRPNGNLPTSIDSVIVPGYYSFATPTGEPSKYYVQFDDTLTGGIAQSYLWDFGDSTTSTQHNPIHLYNHPGVYNVSLKVQSTASGSSSLSNDMVFGQAGNAFQSVFSESSASGNTVHFGGAPGGKAPDTWVLDFGDGNSTTGTNWKNTYALPGIYPATLTVTDATGYIAVAHVNAATQTATACNVYFHSTSVTPLNNPTNLSGVTVEWHDAAGNLYTSANNSQPANSSFKVISVENYKNNTSGQPTKKIHATISCTLYNGASNIVLTGDAVFSIAYP